MERSNRIEYMGNAIRLNENGKQTLSIRDERGWLGYVSIDRGKAMINGVKTTDKETIEDMIKEFKEINDMDESSAIARFVALFDRLIELIRPTGFFDVIGSQNNQGFFDRDE